MLKGLSHTTALFLIATLCGIGVLAQDSVYRPGQILTVAGTLSGTCQVGDIFIKTSGPNIGVHICTATNTWTFNEVTGGAGGAPTDAAYLTQIANGTLTAEQAMGALATGVVINTTTTGVQSIYGGTSCTNQFPRSLNASGAATCASVSLSADATGTLPVANGGTNLTASADDNLPVGNGTTWESKALPSCANGTTDKLLYNISTNTFSCGADQTGAGGGVAFREFYLCPPGNTVAGICHTFTNLGAAFSVVANNASEDHLDLSGFTDFRILARLSTAAVAGDIRIDCDTDAAFGSPTTLGTLDNPTVSLNISTWAAIPITGDNCKTAGIYFRAGMVNGNTTEDPAVRFIRLQVR